MRKSTSLDPLFSKAVQDILAATMREPERWWYLSDLARTTNRRPSSLQSPLLALVESGILERSTDGNRVYFRPDTDCPFLSELRGLVLKTVGLVDILRQSLQPLEDRIECAFVYGSIARGEELSTSDIDLMIIGTATRFDLVTALKEAECALSRPINALVYRPDELVKKIEADNRFVGAVLDREKLFILGTKHDLERVVASKKGRRRTRKQTGTR